MHSWSPERPWDPDLPSATHRPEGSDHRKASCCRNITHHGQALCSGFPCLIPLTHHKIPI